MSRFRAWLRPPRNLMVVFLLVMFVPAATLVVLGLRLLEQDRALEAQRLEESREAAADRVVRDLEKSLTATERQFLGTSGSEALRPSDDALRVVLSSAGIEVSPARKLLYYPVLPPFSEAPVDPFREAEDQEFRRRDYEKAIAFCRALSASPSLAVRAGALLRLARNLRKTGQHQAALDTHQVLARIESVSLGGVPADLVARRTRCAVLEELHRVDDLRREAGLLRDDLRAGRWTLDRGAYLHVARQVGRWLGDPELPEPGREALALAVKWLWENRIEKKPNEPNRAGRHSLSFDGIAVTVLWQSASDRLVALVAGPRFQAQNWFAGLTSQAGSPGLQAALIADGNPVFGAAPPEGAAKVQRDASETGLPWSVVVTAGDPSGTLGEFASRRRLLLAGLAALAVLVMAGSYLIWRAVARDLSVARLQADFVSAVSHEFRTPLTSLRQFTELLVEDDSLPPEKRRSFYEAQARATTRLHRLVESLLDFGRMEAGARPYRFERIEAGALVEAVVEEFRKEPGSRDFTIECKIAEEAASVDAEPDALSQALWNLLDNAVKYSGDSRLIQVKTGSRGGSVTISVHDQGFGIAAREQKEIFRKFVRGAAAGAYDVKGTGIGLAMVRHIVDAHGGTVELVSAPGEGSTFTILLPARG